MLDLEELTRIAWKEKTVASGKAEGVPEALLGLLSWDESVRHRAYSQLDNEVVLQSDLYEAAYFVVPFLITMLRENAKFGRDRVYDLLYEIANGYAPPDVVCLTNEGDEISLKDACLREVNKGRDVFVRDITGHNSQISEKAKELVELLDDYEAANE